MMDNNLKIEQRGFLYIALNDALTHKTKLGLVTFSQFVHHFLGILNSCQENYPDMEFYQYRAHGVLYTWENAAHSPKAIQFIKHFLERIQLEKPVIESTFNAMPEFSVGFHFADVVEGGQSQQRIFFGDAMDEVCKLQALCKHYEQAFLVSEKMAAHCKGASLQYLSRIYLKGSTEAMDIYGE